MADKPKPAKAALLKRVAEEARRQQAGALRKAKLGAGGGL